MLVHIVPSRSSLNLLTLFLLLCTFLTVPNKLQGQREMNLNLVKEAIGTERRLALVIGNKAYQHIGQLVNTTNDADDMAAVLSSLGFDVILRKDLSKEELNNVIDEFGNRLNQYETGLLYYSGHGVLHMNEDYLVPVDAQLKSPLELEDTCVDLGRIMRKMKKANVRVSLAFIDTSRVCFETTLEQRYVSQTRCLRNKPPGSFVAFATRAGDTADDNVHGRNGLFTSELLHHLRAPNLGIREILDRTTLGVSARSDMMQIPSRNDELTEDFKFLVTN